MIDLHMHTKLSTGEFSVDEILTMVNKSGLEAFSIVDNNHCFAYNNLELSKYPNLITGVEIITSIDGLIVEILGYEVNPRIINDWYYNKYSKENIEKVEYKLFADLIKVMKRNNIKLSDSLQLTLVEKGISKKLIFYDAVKNNPNFKFDTYREFYRNGLSNPYSEFFLNEGDTYPAIEDVIELIKRAGGKAILAHPYEYGVSVDTLIAKALDFGIDGIETFHPSCAARQALKLVKICEDNHLDASFGSDFHKVKHCVPLGVHTHRDIINIKCFGWIKKYLNKR